MGGSVLRRRWVRLTTPRSDELALLGVAKNRFSTIPAIRDAENYQQLVIALFEFDEQKLDRKAKDRKVQHDLQLRVRSFIMDHKIKKG